MLFLWFSFLLEFFVDIEDVGEKKGKWFYSSFCDESNVICGLVVRIISGFLWDVRIVIKERK